MWNRKMLAFLLAPIFPSIILLFIFGLTELKWILFLLLFSIPFAYLAILAVGIPLVFFLRKRNSLNALSVTLGGAIGGIAVFYVFGFVFSAILGSPKSIFPSLSELLSGGLLGISVALPFSLILGIPLLSSKE